MSDMVYSEELHRLLLEALQSKDYRSANAILKSVQKIAKDLRKDFRRSFSSVRFFLGAYEHPSWKDKSPAEILNEFYPLIDFYEYWESVLAGRLPKEVSAQKRATRRELRSLRGFMKTLVRKTKKAIIKKAPGWWTGDREVYFKKYL
jgi:ribosomal protein S20